MSKSIKKSAVAAADTKELRSLAAAAGIKFVGVKADDLRNQLNKIAVDDAKPAKKEKPAAKKASKKDEPKAGKKEKPAKKEKKAAAPKREKKELTNKDLADLSKCETKKAKVITMRERGFSIAEISEATELHPTNVSRYIRVAGLSTSTATVPAERIQRIKASIAAKKAVHEPAKVKAAPVKAADKKADKKPVVKAAKKAEKNAGKKNGKKK